MFGSTCYVYYRLKKFFYLISIIIDSEILDELTILEKNVDSEVTKPKRGHKKKAAQMTKSLGKSVTNLYSNLACSVLGVGNQ